MDAVRPLPRLSSLLEGVLAKPSEVIPLKLASPRSVLSPAPGTMSMSMQGRVAAPASNSVQLLVVLSHVHTAFASHC